jgi:type I restriction enzyme R subunit
LEYLKKATECRDRVVGKKRDDAPSLLEGREDALAYFGVALPLLKGLALPDEQTRDVAAEIALTVDTLIQKHWKVNFWNDDIAQKKVIDAIDDFLYDDLKEKWGIALGIEQMDSLIKESLRVAKNRTQR